MFARAQGRALIHGGVRAGLVPAAALAVHQLRFTLAFGGSAGRELALQGHAYLHSLTPWIVLSLALAVGSFIRAVGRAMAGQRSAPRYAVSLAGLWLLCSACLVAIYVTQECLEGVFVIGHPAGLAGIFGFGGWWSIPAALCVGLVLAAIFHGARWALDEVARRSAPPTTPHPARVGTPPRPVDALLPRLPPLAAGCSGRGPPR
jgi:hypothetical protein